jgi:hypothetical protein
MRVAPDADSTDQHDGPAAVAGHYHTKVVP